MLEALRRPFRPAVRRFFASETWLYRVGPLVNMFRIHGWKTPLLLVYHSYFYFRRYGVLHNYKYVTDADILERKRSDTIFVFGSGASLNDIPEEEWARFSKHTTIGCNYFIHQRFLDLDLQHFDTLTHCNGFLRPESAQNGWPKVPYSKFDAEARRYGDIVRKNPRLKECIFFIPHDFFNRSAVVLLSKLYLPAGLRIKREYMRYDGRKNDGMRDGPPRSPAERFPAGLSGALAVSAAYGWRNLVLVGVDLYDSRYFFLPPDQTRAKLGAGDPDAPHPNVAAGRLPWIDNWERALRAEGRRMMIYNPKSLLADRLEQFSWDKIDPPYAEAAERREQPVGTDD